MSAKKQIALLNDKAQQYVVKIKNISNERLYWIKSSYYSKAVTIVLNELAWYAVILWVLGVLALLGLIFYFMRYKNTLVLKLSKEPKELLSLSPKLLNEAKERLRTIDRFETTLELLGVSSQKFDDSLKFFESNQEQKIELLRQNLGGKIEKIRGYYQINLPENFNLHAIKSFLVYVSDEPFEMTKKNALSLQEKVLVLVDTKEQNKMAKQRLLLQDFGLFSKM